MKNQKTNKSPVGLKSFTVKLKKWRCGAGANDSRYRLGRGDTMLLNSEGSMCCLGFACRAAGFKGKLINIGLPSELNAVIPGLNRKVGYSIRDTVFSNRAVRINDSERFTVAQKISKLKRLGEKHGINIQFV